MRLSKPIALTIALLVPALVPGAINVAAQERPVDSGLEERIQVTAVQVPIRVTDSKGNPVTALTVDDLEVLEDGAKQRIVSVHPITASAQPGVEGERVATEEAAPWTIVIYCDQVLSARRTAHHVADALLAQLDDLVGLGSVEVVVADPTPEIVLPATRDAGAIRATLEQLSKKSPGREEIQKLRRAFLRDNNDDSIQDVLSTRAGVGGTVQGGSGRPGGSQVPGTRERDGARDSRGRTLIRASLAQELSLVQRQTNLLRDWFLSYPRGRGPKAAFLVNDGFDLQPREFYLAGASEQLESELGGELDALSAGPLLEDTSRLLAAQGWVTVVAAVGSRDAVMASSASEADQRTARDFRQGQRSPSRSSPRFLASDPLAPLRQISEASGGELTTDVDKLGATLDTLSERWWLTYQVPRSPDGEIHELVVRSTRTGQQVTAPRFVASQTPEEVAIARAQRLAQGIDEKGDLPLQGMLVLQGEPSGGTQEATLAARLALSPIAAAIPPSTDFRVTMAIFFEDLQPFYNHQIAKGQGTSGEQWDYAATMRLPGSVGRVALVVEEMSTGSWGATIAPIARPKDP